MIENKIINIGVVGTGYLGSFHLEQYSQLNDINIVGLYDIDMDVAKKNEHIYKTHAFDSLDDLLDRCDAISIATPTKTHFDIGIKAINADCHVLIEKPITKNINQAEELVNFAEKNNKIIQVGHIERFNPAFYTIKDQNISPLFVESHRLSQFNLRGTDVDVVLDLMIHDIDILLSLTNSEVKEVRASGISVLSENIDTANARIELHNGCVANITASRIAQRKLRKFRFFEENSYTTIDFLNPSIEKYVLSNKKPDDKHSFFTMNENKNKYILYEKPEIKEHNALKKELEHFIDSIKSSKKPVTDGVAGLAALKVAIQIQNYIKEHSHQTI